MHLHGVAGHSPGTGCRNSISRPDEGKLPNLRFAYFRSAGAMQFPLEDGMTHRNGSCRFLLLMVLGTTAMIAAELSGCSSLSTLSIDPGNKLQSSSVDSGRKPRPLRFDGDILALLPRNADRQLSELGYQSTLLRQGLYLDTSGHIEPLTPAQKRHVALNPPPARALPVANPYPIHSRPVTLAVPESSP